MESRRHCVYCLANGEIKTDQVLVRGKHLYLCAPLGQMIEGFVAISPYKCIACLSQVNEEYFEEIESMKSIVNEFYRDAYGVSQATFYEQGRGGAGIRNDPASGFPLHAHLCCLPASVDIHSVLSAQYAFHSLPSLRNLPDIAKDQPYVYVEGTDFAGTFQAAVYLAGTPAESAALERLRLKPCIASALQIPERGNWRDYPGDEELGCTVRRFNAFNEGRKE